MMIKSTRVPPSEVPNLVNYLDKPDDETSVWLRGQPEDLYLFAEMAQWAGRANAVRHIMISDRDDLRHQDLHHVLSRIAEEFGVPAGERMSAPLIAHQKTRSDGTAFDIHYHLPWPEMQKDGYVLESSHTYIRQEKVARLCELELGHEIALGKYNREVYEKLQEEHPQLDLSPLRAALVSRCVDELGMSIDEAEDRFLEYRAHAIYTEAQHRAFGRMAGGRVSLPKTIAHLKQKHREADGLLEFIEDVERIGIDVRRSDAGVWFVSMNDFRLGRLDRITRVPNEAFEDAMSDRLRHRKSAALRNSVTSETYETSTGSSRTPGTTP